MKTLLTFKMGDFKSSGTYQYINIFLFINIYGEMEEGVRTKCLFYTLWIF